MANMFVLDRYLEDSDGTRITTFDGTQSFNADAILSVGVVGQGTKWFVKVTFISGVTIPVYIVGTPFETQAAAVIAKDAFVAALPNNIGDLAEALAAV